VVRQAAVTRFTRLVTTGMRDARELGRVTALAGTVVGERSHEIVRLVAALAVHTGVKSAVGMRGLMARAASLRFGVVLGRAGMRVVAPDTRPHAPLLRMIRELVGLAASTGAIGAALDIMGVVTAGALLVRGDPRATEQMDASVAAAAIARLGFGELVRTVATDALHVPTRK